VDAWVWLCIIAVAGGCAYGYSLYRHPWGRPCRHCDGTGTHRGSTYEYATGHCRWCKGRPRRPRLGVRIFRHEQYLSMRAGWHGKWY
jgi:hypothetical protein